MLNVYRRTAVAAQALASPVLGQVLGPVAHRSRGAARQQIIVILDVKQITDSVRHRQLLLQRRFQRMDAVVHNMEVKPARVRASVIAARSIATVEVQTHTAPPLLARKVLAHVTVPRPPLPLGQP